MGKNLDWCPKYLTLILARIFKELRFTMLECSALWDWKSLNCSHCRYFYWLPTWPGIFMFLIYHFGPEVCFWSACPQMCVGKWASLYPVTTTMSRCIPFTLHVNHICPLPFFWCVDESKCRFFWSFPGAFTLTKSPWSLYECSPGFARVMVYGGEACKCRK